MGTRRQLLATLRFARAASRKCNEKTKKNTNCLIICSRSVRTAFLDCRIDRESGESSTVYTQAECELRRGDVNCSQCYPQAVDNPEDVSELSTSKNIFIISNEACYFNENAVFIHIHKGLCINVMDNTRYCLYPVPCSTESAGNRFRLCTCYQFPVEASLIPRTCCDCTQLWMDSCEC